MNLSDLVELVGLVCIAASAYLVALPLGLLVTGVLLVCLGMAVSAREPGPPAG